MTIIDYFINLQRFVSIPDKINILMVMQFILILIFIVKINNLLRFLLIIPILAHSNYSSFQFQHIPITNKKHIRVNVCVKKCRRKYICT